MDYLYHILVVICIYSILATSMNIVIGLAGMFALCHAVFYAAGAYSSAILTTMYGWPPVAAAGFGVVFAALLGSATALPALRVGGHYLVIITLALQVISVDFLRNVPGLTGGPDGISGIPRIVVGPIVFDTAREMLFLAVPVAVAVYLVCQRLGHSPFGRAMRAMRENESAAISIGKNALRLKLAAFALSAGFAALAGSLMAHYIVFVSPHSYRAEETILILAMIILGGIGNFTGSVLGALILVLLPEAMKFLPLPLGTADLLRNVIYGLILILMLRFRPGGLLPETSNLGKRSARGGESRPEAMAITAFAAPEGETTLSCEGLNKTFGGVVAARNVDLALPARRITGLIGPNGAGKTTVFNMLTGFLKPSSGRIRLRGEDITDTPPSQIVTKGVARSFQDLRLFRRMTVLENVLVAFPRQRGDNLVRSICTPWSVDAEDRRLTARARQILAFIGLDHRADELADNLSYAEEKLLVIARVIATEAEVTLLDEPLSGLDPNTLARVLPVLREMAARGRTICLIEHNLEVIREVCNEVLYLESGEVAAKGSAEELMNNPRVLENYIQ